MMTVGKYLVFLLFAGVLFVSVWTDERHFCGGTLSCEIIEKIDKLLKLKVTLLTGWTLGMGPCGPNCSSIDIRKSTDKSRAIMLEREGGNYFGQFYYKPKHPLNGTSSARYSMSLLNVTGKITAVNEPIQWEQEMLTFMTFIPAKYKSVDIGLFGNYWSSYDNQNHRYIVSANMKPGIRSDTKQPNNSPVFIVKPVYRVLLNDVTVLKIPFLDKDDDIIQCREALFVEKGSVTKIQNTTINKDCSVEISAYESNGFKNNWWGAVALVGVDFNRHDINIDGVGFLPGGSSSVSSLSTVTVKFIILTVENLSLPDFVPPTKDNNHEFTVYIRSKLIIDLWATTSSSSSPDITSFHVQSVPDRNFTVHPPTRNNQTAIVYSRVTWRPENIDVGKYLIRVFISDASGDEGNERNYIIVVKGLDYKSYPALVSSAYLSSLPASVLQCKVYSTCFISVYSGSQAGTKITNLEITNSTIATANISQETNQITEGGQSKTDVSFLSQNAGPQEICFHAKNENGEISEDACIDMKLEFEDACNSLPCLNGGRCRQNESSFVCACRAGFLGLMCETMINVCARNPCGAGTCYQNGIRAVCACPANYTGKYCETSQTCSGVGIKDAQGACICPFGITGNICETVLATEGSNEHNVFLESGSKIMCLNPPSCHIPVFNHGQKMPTVTAKSKFGVSHVKIEHGIELQAISNSSRLFYTTVNVLLNGDQGEICVNLISDGSEYQPCYNLKSVSPSGQQSGSALDNHTEEGGFSKENLNNGSKLQCMNDICHHVVLTKRLTDGTCAQVLTDGIVAFRTMKSYNFCVTELAYNAFSTSLCIQSRANGETICYDVIGGDKAKGTYTSNETKEKVTHSGQQSGSALDNHTEEGGMVLTKEAIIGVSVGTPVSVVGGLGLVTILIKCCLKLNAKEAMNTAIAKFESTNDDEKGDEDDGVNNQTSSTTEYLKNDFGTNPNLQF